jgi:hypothetical protein
VRTAAQAEAHRQRERRRRADARRARLLDVEVNRWLRWRVTGDTRWTRWHVVVGARTLCGKPVPVSGRAQRLTYGNPAAPCKRCDLIRKDAT